MGFATEVGLRLAYLTSVWIHILAATVWIGGAAFLALVLVPAVRKPELAAQAPAFLRAAALRFRSVGWISLAVLIVTGCLNLGFRGFSWQDCISGNIFRGGFGRILGFKISLVAVMLAISGAHDFILGPRAALRILENPGSPEAHAARRRAAWMGRSVLLLGLLIAGAAVLLVRGSF